MRFATLLTTTFLTLSAGLAFSQSRPQLSWQGYVTGSATVYVQGDRVDVQGRDTGSVENPRVTLRDPLPAVRQTVQLDVRRGRGRVNVVEQPTPRNEYSAVVRIDPVGERPEFYQIDFFWNPDASTSSMRDGRRSRDDDEGYAGTRRRDDYGRGTRSRANDRDASGEVTWSGNVDHEAIVEFRARRASTRTLRGAPVAGARSDFSSALPRRETDVRLEKLEGRGDIELAEQPSADNGYAAVVRIRDNEGGAGQYAFRLVWDGDDSGYSQSSSTDSRGRSTSTGGILTPGGSSNAGYGAYGSSGSMRWAGQVDGRVRVHVHNNRAWTSRVSGGEVVNERVDFGGAAMPRADIGDVAVRKLNGRGDVRVVQQPLNANGHTLIFEIDDRDGGADNYEVEVVWSR
ncbi:MAG TPA: hypothetical protein VES20_00665 [Bryobacteraceae bacterium]|nr:hypothetical protein [Bryobacteraceae bacterium]